MMKPARRSVRFLRSAAVLALAVGVAGCPFLEPDQPADPGPDNPDEIASTDHSGEDETSESTSEVCGMEALPSPADLSADACSSGESVLSETYRRTKGSPDRAEESFRVSAPSDICLTVHNGAAGTEGGPGRGGGPDRLSAAWIYIDDQLVFGPDAFNPQTGQMRRSLHLPEGRHTVRVRLASKPGASLRLEAKVAERTTSQPTTLGENGLLEVRNVAVDHPLFSPNGDGYHETALFNADNLPKRLPGKSSGRYSYAIDWEWRVTDVDTCERLRLGLSGTTPVNSPTNVQIEWDGTDASGAVVPDGKYLYQYHAELVRSDGRTLDTVDATPRGLLVDTTVPDYAEPSFGQRCNRSRDPNNCKCPNSTSDGTRCTFAWIPYLTSFESPADIDTSKFLTSRRAPESGRWEVVVDLRTFNGGGLVPQSDGTWENVDALQTYVSELTGVPADPNDLRLFNFDYTQLGYSTPVVRKKGIADGFNHFLLDVITDASGNITIDGTTIDLKAALQSSGRLVPDRFRIAERHRGQECGYNGNTDGDTTVRAKSCTNLRTANLDPGETNLGIYVVEKSLFDTRIDGRGTTRDGVCVLNGIFKCGVRTFQRDVDTSLTGIEYAETEEIRRVRRRELRSSGTPAIVTHTDRLFSPEGAGTVIDGVCSNDTASRGPIRVPLDSGAGALSDMCVINGIF